MGYRLAADAVLVTHLAFIVFAVLGAALVLRWTWVAALHLPAAGWAFWIEWHGAMCPLTPLENMLRQKAGLATYSGGFIEHYLLPIIYPPGLTRDVELVLAFIVLAINVTLYGLVLWRRPRLRRTA